MSGRGDAPGSAPESVRTFVRAPSASSCLGGLRFPALVAADRSGGGPDSPPQVRNVLRTPERAQPMMSGVPVHPVHYLGTGPRVELPPDLITYLERASGHASESKGIVEGPQGRSPPPSHRGTTSTKAG